jgi:hypothetical protein
LTQRVGVAIEARTTSRGQRYKVRLRRPDGTEYSRARSGDVVDLDAARQTRRSGD